MKRVMGSSAVWGTVVAIAAFAVADIGGPVAWVGYWCAVVAVLSRV